MSSLDERPRVNARTIDSVGETPTLRMSTLHEIASPVGCTTSARQAARPILLSKVSTGHGPIERCAGEQWLTFKVGHLYGCAWARTACLGRRMVRISTRATEARGDLRLWLRLARWCAPSSSIPQGARCMESQLMTLDGGKILRLQVLLSFALALVRVRFVAPRCSFDAARIGALLVERVLPQAHHESERTRVPSAVSGLL